MAFANPFDAADFLFAVRTAIRGVNLQPLCLSSGRWASSQRCLHERHCIYILQTASPLLHITIIPFTCRQFHLSRKEDKYLYNGVVLRPGSTIASGLSYYYNQGYAVALFTGKIAEIESSARTFM